MPTPLQGRTVSFKNSIIIMTSNLGSAAILESALSTGDLDGPTIDRDSMREAVMGAVRQHFRCGVMGGWDGDGVVGRGSRGPPAVCVGGEGGGPCSPAPPSSPPCTHGSDPTMQPHALPHQPHRPELVNRIDELPAALQIPTKHDHWCNAIPRTHPPHTHTHAMHPPLPCTHHGANRAGPSL
jgi:hypothetical protein